MAKKEDIMAAINFAAQQLAPRASKDPSFVEDLNYGMCLVVFNQDKLQPDIQKLLDKNLRLQIADQVNEAILLSANEFSENQVRSLLKSRLWAEQKCREMRKNIPQKIPLGLSPDEMVEEIREEMNGNGDADAMIQ
jgi:glucose-induced degradation protein 8